MGQEPGACKPAGDRTAGRRCLHDALAGGATELGSYVPDHPIAFRHILDHLTDVLAHRPQYPTAGRACARCLVNDLLARQSRRQRASCWLSLGRLLRRSGLLREGCSSGLQILQGQLHLSELTVQLLGGAAVPGALEAGDLKAQLLQLDLLGDHETPQGLYVVGQLARFGHATLYVALIPHARQRLQNK